MSAAAAPTKVRSFGHLDGRDIREIIVTSADGAIEASVIELGAAIRDMKVRRANGQMQRVVLGLNSAVDYRSHSPHMGAIAGRFANRIARGHFVLDGKSYQLPLNENGRTALHGGGATGFGKVPWTLLHASAAEVVLALFSPAGDNGFPGTLTVVCRYWLKAPATLRMELTAFCDAPTVVNLCNHSYFNLGDSADVLDHELEVRANLYTPTNADLIPDGTFAPVSGTHLDFRTKRPLGSKGGERRGIDNTFVLRRDRIDGESDPMLPVALAATLSSPQTGLTMECWTSEPALQVYDGFKLAVPVVGLDGARYGAYAGIALEAQHFPDSPNLPHFPTTALRPGSQYRQVTEYRFSG